MSHASEVMLKNTVEAQARLQQYMGHEISDVQAGFRKGRGTRDQIASIHWIIKKAREFQKNIYCFIDYAKAFDYVDHNKLWKILQEMGIPDHLTRLLRNLYAGQEATVRTGHGTTDWFQIGKGVCQGCLLRNLYAGQEEATVRAGHGTRDSFQIGKGVCQGCLLSPCLFNLYSEYIKLNVGLNQAQAVILVSETVKCLSAMQETWVPSLGREDPLEKEMIAHSSTLAWKIPWMEDPGRLQPMGLQRVGNN